MHDVIEETCRKHNIYLWQSKKQVVSKNNVIPHFIKFCPECRREKTEQEQAEVIGETRINEVLLKTHAVLERESVIPRDLKDATYSNFRLATEADKQAYNFGLRLNRYWFKEEKTGNAFLVGTPGVGKSHLTLAIARKLNDDFKANGEPKSVLFMPIQKLFSIIKDGFNNPNGRSREEMMKLLSGVDYLFLDDLGKETNLSGQQRQASEWKQEFLYELLDSRENTFFNTNFNSKQLQGIYDKALLSRIGKGAKGNSFVYPADAEDKRVLPF